MAQRSIVVPFVLLIILTGTLGLQAVFAEETRSITSAHETDKLTPGNTLVSVQSYRTSGRLLEVTPSGQIVWEFSPPRSNVFDAEVINRSTILVAVATKRQPQNCPTEQLQVDSSECVENRVLELDYQTKEVVWKYTWYDEYLHNHEVHDVDRLPNGNTAIIDMGNDRAFIVNRSGEITWEWQAEKHLGKGTEFYRKYGGEPDPGGEKDWTHMNDIDRLANGNFQLSVRNFDVAIEVDPVTHEIQDVVGNPGNHELLYEQHNPDRLPSSDTLIVADSENDRIVELNATTQETIWKYGGNSRLNWPRDADRLPSGNTLISDSFNDRVIEVNPAGEIVWEFKTTDLVYSADRIGVPENSTPSVSGRQLESRVDNNVIIGTIQQYEAYAKYVFPLWTGVPELVNMLLLLGSGLWLSRSVYQYY